MKDLGWARDLEAKPDKEEEEEEARRSLLSFFLPTGTDKPKTVLSMEITHF